MEVVGSNRDHFDSLCWQVDLSNNSIGGYKIYDPESREYKTTSTPEGPQAIADAIRVTPSMTSIDLRNNGFGPEGAKALAPAIRDTSITSVGKDGLNLKGNRLGDEGWGAIFAAVCSSTVSKVTSIDASFEGIGPEGAKLIGQALRNSVNPSLTQVCAAVGSSWGRVVVPACSLP